MCQLTAEFVHGSGTVHELCHELLTVTCSDVDERTQSYQHSTHCHNDSVPRAPYVVDCTTQYLNNIKKLFNQHKLVMSKMDLQNAEIFNAKRITK